MTAGIGLQFFQSFIHLFLQSCILNQRGAHRGHNFTLFIKLTSYTATLARQEIAYVRVYTDFTAYDGRVIRGFYFESIPERVFDTDRPCSKRYMNVLIKVRRREVTQP